jgi:hypothetical protein
MKKVLGCLISMLSILFSLNGQTIAQLDQKNGFRDIKLGSTIESFGNKIRLDPNPSQKEINVKEYIYDIKSMDTTLYEATIKHIYLTFYKGKLWSMSIGFGRYETYEEILSVCNGLNYAYGVTTKCNPDGNSDWLSPSCVCWTGNKVYMSFYMYSFVQDPSIHSGFLSIIDIDITKQKNLDEL